MEPEPYPETLARFEALVREKPKSGLMAALIIDSPWLPGYGGMDQLDFYFDPEAWLAIHRKAREDLPGVAFVPGTWVEYGMATEPSGFGTTIQWSRDSSSVRAFPGGLSSLVEQPVPNPETDGLMPAALRQYERLKPRLTAEGLSPRMAAARGPLAVASHLVGVTELLMATQLEPEACLAVIDKTTELCIRWLRAQLERMDDPLGVLVLDDVVGMISPKDAERFALPFFKRIFDAFPGLVRLFHDDTPGEKVFPGLATTGMDVFNFTHKTSLTRARELVGPDVVLMGNLPPLSLLVRGTPAEVRAATGELLDEAAAVGPVLVSPGGGVSPGTPIENLQAMNGVLQERLR